MLQFHPVAPATPQEELAIDFFHNMGPDLAAFKANYRKRLAGVVVEDGLITRYTDYLDLSPLHR